MFIHMVLFKIRKINVPIYIADCRMWEREARRQSGFLSYHTLFRSNKKGHYASLYFWKSKKDHSRFMKKHHDRLVSFSKCPVEVLGYFDFSPIGRIPATKASAGPSALFGGRRAFWRA